MTQTQQTPKLRGWLRTAVSILLCCLALAAGGAVFLGLASLKEQPAQRPVEEKVFKVDVYEAERQPLGEVISGFGTSRPYREVVLSAEVGGRIVEKYPLLKPGERVEASKYQTDATGRTIPDARGLPLVRIDPETYAKRVEQATGRIAEIDAELKVLEEQEVNNQRLLKKAQADVEVYQREFDRIEGLGQRGVTSKTDVTSARLELERYKQAVLNMENELRLFPVKKLQLEKRRATAVAELESAKLDLERTEIHPPFNGVLSEVSVELGQNVRPGDPLLKILDLDVIEIPVPLPLEDYEKIAALLKAGEKPTVSLARNATSPTLWTGYIERVAAEADESTRTVNVFIRVENSEQPVPLLPGSFVHARIQGPTIPDAVAIPRDCVIDGAVYVAKDGRAVKRDLGLGRTLQAMVLVEKGLDAGDEVVMTNLDVLEDQAQIDVQRSRTLADELELLQVPLIMPRAAARQPVGGGGSSE